MNVGAYTNHLLDSEPNLSEKELQGRVNGYIALCWRQETTSGREFEKHYASPENINRLAAIFSLLDEQVSFEALSGAFKKLVASGALKTPGEIREAAERAEQERDEANRIKWQNDCEAWIDSHSTREIAERSKTDKAFASYLKAVNRLPEVATEYSGENLMRQREAQKLQRERDRRYANVPAELWAFAESYKKLLAAEALKRMRDPSFKADVDACVSAGIL